MAENTTASRRVQAAEREKAAFALRIAGATYAQIGAQLGVTGCAAHKMVKRVLERTRGETDAEAVELRRLETERLDALQVALWGLASKGDAGAIDRILKIMERRARLLGLDAPTRGDVTSGGQPLTFRVVYDRDERDGLENLKADTDTDTER